MNTMQPARNECEKLKNLLKNKFRGCCNNPFFLVNSPSLQHWHPLCQTQSLLSFRNLCWAVPHQKLRIRQSHWQKHTSLPHTFGNEPAGYPDPSRPIPQLYECLAYEVSSSQPLQHKRGSLRAGTTSSSQSHLEIRYAPN